MKTAVIMGVVLVAVGLAFCGSTATKTEAEKLLRVGVYDSRAIAVAFVQTGGMKDEMARRMKEMEQAKAAGDQKKIDELKAWGREHQQQMHRQGFGTAPVQDLLKPVEKELPAVAEKAGVDVIVSKWQIDYQAKEAEFIDVTDAMVALYKPSEKTLKIIAGLKTKQPLSEEQLLKVEESEKKHSNKCGM